MWTDYDSVNKTLKAKFANASFKKAVLEADIPLLKLCAETLAAADEIKELDYIWLGTNEYEASITPEVAACMGKSLPRVGLKNFKVKLMKKTLEEHGGAPGTAAQVFEVRTAPPPVRGAPARARCPRPCAAPPSSFALISPVLSCAGLLRRGRARGVRQAGASALRCLKGATYGRLEGARGWQRGPHLVYDDGGKQATPRTLDEPHPPLILRSRP